ncbi:MAG: hypothetical protein B6229_07450 [Spirochaetaceae bacterium 4572_7]|nr:MAG: hypothetical protein B6229_07450 [Spirochaetaceae bacterium 4572_7]
MKKLDKYDRQNNIILKLKNNPNLKQADLGRSFGVSKATISRDFLDLTEKRALFQDENDSYSVNPNYFLDNIQFSLTEAFSLYASTALMADRIDHQHPSLISALRKLSEIMTKKHNYLGPLVSNVANTNESLEKDDKFSTNLDKIITAWAKGLLIQITYNSRRSGNTVVETVGILDFVPYADGHGNHLVCYHPKAKVVKPYRFKRIKQIIVLNRPFDSSNRVKLLARFNSAWKIWLSDNDDKRVVLRFNKAVAGRVQETIWHRNQAVELQSDGSLLWMCDISEPKEMEYWILGWGANVEVLSPPDLRKRIEEEIKELIKKYNIFESVSLNETGRV